MWNESEHPEHQRTLGHKVLFAHVAEVHTQLITPISLLIRCLAALGLGVVVRAVVIVCCAVKALADDDTGSADY